MDGYVDIATRRAGSIDVTLLWHRSEGTLVVVAHDELTGEGVEIPVDGDRAAEVYRHPFAYASATGTGRPRLRTRRPALR
jgi:hypothetical protein